MIPSRLEPFLAEESTRLESALRAVVVDDGPMPPPERGLRAAMAYALEAGGKRLRPILCVAAYRAFREDVPPGLYRLAASLELIHTYSLVHDDLPSMDDDEVRRGRPSTHVAHGVATATLAGAALIPAAVSVALSGARELALPGAVQAELVRTLCRAAGGGGMVGGQLLDLEAEGRPVELDELERIHRRKTGALLAAAPLMGGIAAGAGERAREALTVYGTSVGLAFQVTDDILDVTGSSAVLGKPAGRDSALEKATYPSVAGLYEARSRAAAEVDTALAALSAVGIDSPELSALARYAADRDR